MPATIHILTELSINLGDIDIAPHGILAPLSGIVLNQDASVVIDHLSEAFLVKAIDIEEIGDRDFVVLHVQHKTHVMAIEHRNAKQDSHLFAIANRLPAAERFHDTSIRFVRQQELRRARVHHSIKRN